MAERPHGRKRNDSGKTGVLKRIGKGLGRKIGVGNSGRGNEPAIQSKNRGHSSGSFER